METNWLNGRSVIYSKEEIITEENLLDVLMDAENVHSKNEREIDYLYKYYRGKQPILGREKEIRPEINNKIVENRANEIVTFKTGYLCGEPIQYVSRNGEQNVVDAVKLLNDYMNAEDKASKDQEIVEWDMICGTAYRMVLPDNGVMDECPFEIYTLDPRNAYVVYSRELGNKPLLGVTYYADEYGVKHYSVYTDRLFYKVENGEIVGKQPHILGMIPIVEYPANNARLGAFEIVLPLLDALNNIESNRMDGVEQTIQAFLKFINCDVDGEQLEALKALGAIKISSTNGLNADVDVVKTDLDQGQTQTFKADIYQSVLEICGMPSMSDGSSSDSSNNGAVLLRQGWTLAESRAKDYEHIFKKSEKKMLQLVLKLCENLAGLNIRLLDIETKFTRRNYEDIYTKAQVLDLMLKNPKVHPLLAYQHCGMFSDAESAYQMGNNYYEEQMAKWETVTVDEHESESVPTE